VVGELALRGPAGEPVDLRRSLASHGVATLPPQSVDPGAGLLETTVALADGGARTIRVRGTRPELAAVEVLHHDPEGSVAKTTTKPSGSWSNAPADEALVGLARHLLSLDEDLSRFYQRAAADPSLSWVAAGAGRMLRSPTVFEDVAKTICTTNCTWSATIRMVTALVAELGEAAPGGLRAFPGPEAMAAAGDNFYRGVARAGYRGPYLRKLAAGVAGGELDLESLHDPGLPDEEVRKRLLALPGVGPYAAAHVMLVTLGRYRQLILDSWTRPTYARLAGRKAADRTIERRFRKFGEYAGLAFWLYLTKDWVEDQGPA
jgi:N-glycosylase/DNA lyase